MEEYVASSQATIRAGIRFTYQDRFRRLPRVCYYGRVAGRLTVLNQWGTFISNHFAATESYVRRLPQSTYPSPASEEEVSP